MSTPLPKPAQGQAASKEGTLPLLLRFVSVGVLATGVHLVIAFGLVTLFGVPVQGANLLAFLSALSLSFFCHHRFTFRSRQSYGVTSLRFAVTAGGAYLGSAALLWGLQTGTTLPPALQVVLAAGIIPVITFIAGRYWVFE